METDLHLHLDSSLSMDMVRTLTERVGYDLEGKDLKKLLCVGDDCASLAECLSCFDLPGILLQTGDALELVPCDLVKRLAIQGLMYAEIRFTPQLHRQKGLTQEQAVETVVRGVQADSQESGMYTGVPLCTMVNGGGGDNEETLEFSRAYLRKNVVGADVAEPERLVPMKHFEGMFRQIYQADVPSTIHAGECRGYKNVALAASYGVWRISHGCAVVRSEACMDLLKRENITLGMCIVSNLQTEVAEGIEAHPLKGFYARGIRVTYNTDDMMVSDTGLEWETALITSRMGLTQKDLIRMNEVAVEARFAGVGVGEGILRRMRERSGIWKQKRNDLDECLDESLKEYQV